MLREALEHPLVMHARTVFDAAVRKVEPPRRDRPTPMPQAGRPAEDAGGESGDENAVICDDRDPGEHEHVGSDGGGIGG